MLRNREHRSRTNSRRQIDAEVFIVLILGLYVRKIYDKNIENTGLFKQQNVSVEELSADSCPVEIW